jgi:uncharacterized protein (DUF2267 family)
MKDEEFISAIRKTSGIEDAEQVKTAARATLRVLSERVSGNQPRGLAGQLPPVVADDMPDQGGGERFGIDEFYQRIAEAEGCSHDDARRHARAVMAAVASAVGRSEIENMLSQLPSDYVDLGISGPTHQ